MKKRISGGLMYLVAALVVMSVYCVRSSKSLLALDDSAKKILADAGGHGADTPAG